MDFAPLVAAVPSATILLGITAIAAVKFGPAALRWGYNQIMRFIR